jgi:indolepyruvate ferredoxin oxidoreductase beta subunit
MIMNSKLMQRILSPLFRKGRNISTTSISGFTLFYALSKLRVMRRITYRYKQQQLFINDWLDRVTAAACDDYEYGLAVARCIEIVKGYGETYERGKNRYLAIVDSDKGAKNGNSVNQLHRAALADEKGKLFAEALASLGAGR